MKIIPETIEDKTKNYIINHLAVEDNYLKKVIEEMENKGVRKINITPFEGNIISTIISTINPKRGVEIGTLCGYSTIWLTRSISEDGKIYTIEKEPKHAEIALKIFSELGLDKKIVLMNYDAKEALNKLSKFSPFDFCFIDADKPNYPYYLKWAIKNLRSGGIVLAHNAFMKGKLFYDGEDKEQNQKSRGMREFLHIIFTDEKISHRSIIPTSDGIAFAIIK
ncbi:MAG: O-methyltransferase [Elusimicrobiota bacterium]